MTSPKKSNCFDRPSGEIRLEMARYGQRDTKTTLNGCLITPAMMPIYREVLHTRVATVRLDINVVTSNFWQ
jgi:hypothetical protein